MEILGSSYAWDPTAMECYNSLIALGVCGVPHSWEITIAGRSQQL